MDEKYRCDHRLTVNMYTCRRSDLDIEQAHRGQPRQPACPQLHPPQEFRLRQFHHSTVQVLVELLTKLLDRHLGRGLMDDVVPTGRRKNWRELRYANLPRVLLPEKWRECSCHTRGPWCRYDHTRAGQARGWSIQSHGANLAW